MLRPMHIIFSMLFAIMVTCGYVCAQDYTLSQYLSIQSATLPSFDAASKNIVYRTNISGVPQIWRMLATGGYQKQITFDTNGVAQAWFSPRDLNLMVISAAVGGNERFQLYLANPEGGKWIPLSADRDAIYNFGCWSRDGSRFAYATNSRNKTDFDIYEYNVDGLSHTLLYEGTGSLAAADYSPDNRYLLIEQTYSSFKSDLLLYDGETNRTGTLTTFEGEANHSTPQWEPGGRGFFFRTDRNRDFMGIAYWPLDSSSFRWIETPEWDVERFRLSPDSTFLTWTINTNGYSRFNFRNLRNGDEIGPYRFPSGVISGLTFSVDGQYLAVTFGSAGKPTDIWMYDIKSDRLRQVTSSASGGILPGAFIEPQLIEYTTFDGKKIPAFWYAPQNSKGKFPVLVVAHGGPESQSRPTLNPVVQYFLSRGYGVIEPNIRGSSGYGKEYLSLDNVRKRMDSVTDIEYAARWVCSQPSVDSTKLVIWGGSYGGFVVLSSLTTFPDRWAAGASFVGIANFVTFLQNTGSYRRALREAEYGTLAEDSVFLAQISPVNNVSKIRAPLLLVQGANDPRVPKTEADQMAAAVKAQGGIVEYLLFGDEGHGLTKLKNRIDAYSAADAFLKKYVWDKKSGS